MKKLLTVVLAASIIIGCERDTVPLPPTPAIDVVQAQIDLFVAHNAIRASNSEAALVLDPKLTQAAITHSDDMANGTFLSHTGSDRSDAATRAKRAGYQWRAIAENVAGDYRTVKAVMDAWMKSLGHRRNILGSYHDIGVAVRIGKNGQAYWTTVFGTQQ
jgi:uncharacterized protein YkwD